MNKKIISLIISSIITISIIGCEKRDDKSILNTEIQDIGIYNENERPYLKSLEDVEENIREVDNELIYKQYEKVNKNDLKYETVEDAELVFEHSTGLAIESPLQDLKPVNDKRYTDILLGYQYWTEENPTYMTYDEAIDMVKKVLPDDIVKEKVLEDTNNGFSNIFYKSSKGNFIVSFKHPIEEETAYSIKTDNSTVIGISYYKEV